MYEVLKDALRPLHVDNGQLTTEVAIVFLVFKEIGVVVGSLIKDLFKC